LKWTEPNEKELLEFLVGEKSFNEDRVKKAIGKLKSRVASPAKVQNKLENYFSPKRKVVISHEN
jgi:flap endonuclease-1